MEDVDVIRLSENVLYDASKSLQDRIRALFTLKSIPEVKAMLAMVRAMYDDSELLGHEAAYCLGQQALKEAIPHLSAALSNVELSPIVRHEAGEALGAINDPSIVEILKKHVHDKFQAVAETCQLAIDRIQYFQRNQDESSVDLIFGTSDPAPPHSSTDINYLEKLLLDRSASLFDRYRAMFALRNIETDESISVLVKGFECDGDLFKHEIAFVLGQMRPTNAVRPLIAVVERESEHPMVRHECAEALGNIATDECTSFLKTRLNDKDRIVRESCYVALDIASYQNSTNFEYISA